jgi:hypothetical protein
MERRAEQIVESSVEAQQGFLGRPVLVVLVVSCLLAVAALALSSRVFSGTRSGPGPPGNNGRPSE